jgi:ankyrin repeat protein
MKILYQTSLLILILVCEAAASDLCDFTSKGNVEAVRSLLLQGEDPNKKDDAGLTAIFYAIKNQNVELFELLLSNGALLKIYDKQGFTTEQYLNNCLRRSGKNRLKAMKNLREMGIPEKFITNNYPLQHNGTDFSEAGHAIWAKMKTIAEPYLEAEPDPGDFGKTYASDLDRMKAFMEIPANRIYLNMQGKDGETALMKAISREDAEIVEYLLAEGANPDLKDNDGKNAFDYLEKVKDAGVKKEILQHLKQAEMPVSPAIVPEKASKSVQSIEWWAWVLLVVLCVGGLLLWRFKS